MERFEQYQSGNLRRTEDAVDICPPLMNSTQPTRVLDTVGSGAIDKLSPMAVDREAGRSGHSYQENQSLKNSAENLHLPKLTITESQRARLDGKESAVSGKESVVSGNMLDKPPGDQKLEITPEKTPDKVETQSPAERIQSTRDSLMAAAQVQGIDVARLGVFLKDFEQRCNVAEQRGLVAPSGEQIAKTFSTLTEMLKGPSESGGLSDQDRAALVKTTLYNLANPLRIDQGLNLCNVTTAEVYTATRHPENYARLLKEVSLTGAYTTTTGKRITLPSGSIDPGSEQLEYTSENVGTNRWTNWTSKIFQETGINSVVPFLEPNLNYPAWGKPHAGGKSDMAMPQILSACEEINGRKMPYFGDGDAPSAAELLKLKEDGDFPAGVHTIHVQDSSGVVSGLHVQTIQDVRVRDGQVQVFMDNQRGGSNDQGWVSLQQLHEIQNYPNLPAQWYEIPQQYLKRDFDSVALPGDSSTREQRNSVEPRAAHSVSEVSPIPEQQPERTEAPAQRNSQESRRQLEQALFDGIKEGTLKSERIAKIREILDSLEKRCVDDRASGLVAPGESQIAQAYQAALETLTSKGIMPYQDRHKMVLEGLRNISDPRGINQGDHGSCGNTCAEKFIAVRNPEKYMQALQQVAADGKISARDGRKIQLPYDDLRQCPWGNRVMTWQRGWKPDSEASGWDVYKENGWHPLQSTESRRNYASQIIQNLNLADALESARLGQRQAPNQQFADGLSFLHVEDFSKRMTGKPITTINQNVQTEGNIMQALTDDLACQLKKDGRLPAMVWRAWHWQTIHDVRTVPGRDPWGRPGKAVQVLSDNQWGNYRDRGWVTVPQLQQELSENP